MLQVILWKSYLKQDGILYEETLPIQLPSGETIQVGYHHGIVRSSSISYVFFHHAATFMRPYPSGSPSFLLTCTLNCSFLISRSNSDGSSPTNILCRPFYFSLDGYHE